MDEDNISFSTKADSVETQSVDRKGKPVYNRTHCPIAPTAFRYRRHFPLPIVEL